ncbi:thioredoxin-like protein [Coniophora puteana RWD-64-598 SS2]|uniref:glutathione transferase n=1 Tax=Coniophora puteana (strain RWD-64-598) TaxID=741705 RepID=A0A5M3MDN6_CONPW|nr:thioredoxin-like protein [Coniophora puteana RWD-64-598 SS2]EIW77157.1 thioredoxin-like protein [Coniophora puteana RWD-64-598 SS2]
MSTETQSKVIVHHLNDSRSQRVLWLLEELEVPYEIKYYTRGSDLLAPKDLLKVSPLGKSPVITDGDMNLAESGAIVTYLIEKYGKAEDQPPTTGKVHDLYFTHYSEGSLMPLLVNKLIFQIVPTRAPFLLRPLLRMVFATLTSQLVEPELKKHQTMIEEHLSKTGPWFAGGQSPTAADYMMAFPLEAIDAANRDSLGHKSREYVKMIHERPAYKRALERGGEYSYAKL